MRRRPEGHRRDRHHQPAGNHRGVGPRTGTADASRHRLAGPAHRGYLRQTMADGHEPAISAQDRADHRSLLLGTKVAWILDQVPVRGKSASAASLPFGTVDCFLLWRLTGGKVHATDVTNASRTLLFNIHTGHWDDDLLNILRVPRSMLPEVKDSPPSSATACPTVRRRDRDLRHRRRPAGRHHRPGLFLARHDQIHLRHRLLCAAQYRRDAGRLNNRLLTTIAYQLAASAPTRWKARSSSPAPRCNGCATGSASSSRPPRPARSPTSRIPRSGLPGAGLRRSRRAVLGSARARRAVRAHPQYRSRRAGARRARGVCYQTPICSTPCGGLGSRRRESVLRVDGGMAASDWTMQRLSDLLVAPVDRPRILETTALGAAWLAGSPPASSRSPRNSPKTGGSSTASNPT